LHGQAVPANLELRSFHVIRWCAAGIVYLYDQTRAGMAAETSSSHQTASDRTAGGSKRATDQVVPEQPEQPIEQPNAPTAVNNTGSIRQVDKSHNDPGKPPGTDS
jgi:hypothetical protein